MTATPTVPARRRPTTWLALAMLFVGLAMNAFLLLQPILPGYERLRESGAPQDFVGLALSISVYLSVIISGSLLAIRRPGNPIGWLLLVGGLCFSYADFSLVYVQRSIELETELPGYRLVDYMLTPVSSLGTTLLFIWIPLLFPDGRLPGTRWRTVAWAAAITTVAYVATGTASYEVSEYGPYLPNPLVLDSPLDHVLTLTTEVTFMLYGGFIVLAFASVVLRFRRADGVERQQLKWFLAAAAVLLSAVAVLGFTLSPWAWNFLLISIGLVPIAVGIAVLRYRLYEIDRLISRTIGWALVTGILAAVFVGVVIGLQALLAGVTQGETLAVAASTLVAFALFQPLRRRIQVTVDRRFDRARYDGQRTVDAFAEELRDKVEFVDIDHDLHRAIQATVRPAHVGVWLRSGGKGADG